MRNFEEYPVWRLAHRLALDVYRSTRAFPNDERFGLRSQLRRAAVSIPSNIAEGSARSSESDFARLLDIAAGSASELVYQLRLARDLGYIGEAAAVSMRDAALDVSRMLTGLRRHIRSGV